MANPLSRCTFLLEQLRIVLDPFVYSVEDPVGVIGAILTVGGLQPS